ncbi:hypothetical protein ACFL7E_04835 [Thermodesulfobacteriota bacterium]
MVNMIAKNGKSWFEMFCSDIDFWFAHFAVMQFSSNPFEGLFLTRLTGLTRFILSFWMKLRKINDPTENGIYTLEPVSKPFLPPHGCVARLFKKTIKYHEHTVNHVKEKRDL